MSQPLFAALALILIAAVTLAAWQLCQLVEVRPMRRRRPAPASKRHSATRGRADDGSSEFLLQRPRSLRRWAKGFVPMRSTPLRIRAHCREPRRPSRRNSFRARRASRGMTKNNGLSANRLVRSSGNRSGGCVPVHAAGWPRLSCGPHAAEGQAESAKHRQHCHTGRHVRTRGDGTAQNTAASVAETIAPSHYDSSSTLCDSKSL
jgi:hypothetical protein